MILNSKLAPILNEAGEGEVILAGQLLAGLDSEPLSWVVMENVPMGNYRRITLHAYWHEIFIVSKVVNVNGHKITWGATGGKK